MGPLQLRAHLEELGVNAGANVCIHSRLVSFGKVEGGVAAVLDTIADVVGPTGSLAFPTFTLHLGEEDVYDPAATRSRASGALGEFARTRQGYQRTLSPTHSFVVHGEAAEVLLAADWSCTVGHDSVFDLMAASGFQLLLLGCSFQEGATYPHQVEAELEVEYRDWITLSRTIRFPEGNRQVSVRHFARRRGTPVTNLVHIERHARSSGCGKFVGVPGVGRVSCLVSLTKLNAHAREYLTVYPRGLLERAEP